MATKRTNNSSEYQKSMAQYQAVAEYAKSVFARTRMSEEYERPMSAKEVQKYLFSRIFIDDADGYDINEKHTIEAEGLSVCTTPKEVFGLCIQFESMLKIKPADKVKFMHEYTPDAKDIFGVCTLPTNAKDLAACAADDELRPTMCGVYVDFKESKAVASDGRILRVMPIVCKSEHLGGVIIPTDFFARHAGEEILVCGEITEQKVDGEVVNVLHDAKYAYAGKERAKLVEGRYPNWKSVVPAYNVAQSIALGEVWPELRDAIKSMGQISGCVAVEGKVGSRMLTVRVANEQTGVNLSKEIEMPCPVAFDFVIGVNADYVQKIGAPTSWSMKDATRAMLFTPGIVGETQEFTLLMPRLIDETPHDVALDWSTQERGDKYAKAAKKTNTQKPEAEPAPAPEKPKASKPKKVEEKVVVCSVPKESKADVTPTPAEESKHGSYSVVINDVVVAEVTHSDVNDTVPAEVSTTPQETPKAVCDTAMARIHGTWVPVEEMTRTNGRIMVRRIDNKQRAIVTLADFRTKGSSMPTDEVTEPATAPVCDTPAEPTQDATTKPEPEATDDNAVYIADYSEKAIFVWGATKSMRRELKKYGSWNGKRSGWILSKKRREYVEKLFGNKLQAAPMPAAPAQEETVNAAA